MVVAVYDLFRSPRAGSPSNAELFTRAILTFCETVVSCFRKYAFIHDRHFVRHVLYESATIAEDDMQDIRDNNGLVEAGLHRLELS